MKMPPNMSTAMALAGEDHVARAADKNHTKLETNWPAKPPRKIVRTSRCASRMFIELSPTLASGGQVIYGDTLSLVFFSKIWDCLHDISLKSKTPPSLGES